MRTRIRLSRVLPFFLLCLAGCASIENAHPAHPVGPDGRPYGRRETASGLVVTGEEISELSSTYFGVLAFTFVNPTNDWLRIDNVVLDFGSQARNESIALPWGEEIASWELATSQRNAIRRANTNNALGALMAAGFLTARVAGRSEVGAIGGLVSIGAAAGLAGKALAHERAALTFPPAHLLATPFSVPPGLFAKKWVLLNGPKTRDFGCIHSVALEYDSGKGRERVQLYFQRTGSDWQKAVCGPA